MGVITRFYKNRALHQALEESRGRLYRIAYSWCHNPALADDLVQETLTKALKYSDQLRDPNTIRSWLYKILTNCWRDHFRRNRETVDIDDVVLVDDHDAQDHQERMEVVEKVRAGIATLPVGQRQVLTLVDLEGCSYIEVAEILEVPIGTIMSRLCRARRALKEALLTAEDASVASSAHLRRVK
jgi:RNA polymerase sigma-70 factor (ECF subfamily)